MISLLVVAKSLYCTVQYSMALPDDNSIASKRAAVQRNRSHKMLLIQEIQAPDCQKYFCLHSRRKAGEINA